MTQEQWTLVIGGGVGTAVIAALVTVLTQVLGLWGTRAAAVDERTERRDGIGQADKERLWRRVEQLESDAKSTGERHERELAALGERHDREIAELRVEIRQLQTELSDAKAAVALTEVERERAIRLYSELLIAHQALKRDHEALQLQVAALTAENAEMRRRLPPGKEEP